MQKNEIYPLTDLGLQVHLFPADVASQILVKLTVIVTILSIKNLTFFLIILRAILNKTNNDITVSSIRELEISGTTINYHIYSRIAKC